MPRASRKGLQPWDGGFRTADGTYYIRKKLGGTLYEFSLRTKSSGVAEHHLREWEKDRTYRPVNQPVPTEYPPLRIRDVSAAYLLWCKQGSDKPNCGEWAKAKQRALAWWAKQLKDADLRTATLDDHFRPALKDERGSRRALFIKTIKHLYTWLLTEQVEFKMNRERKSPVNDLLVPQAEQTTDPRDFAPGQYQNLRPYLAGKCPDCAECETHCGCRCHSLKGTRWLDAVDVLAGTGWHATALIRFVAGVERNGKVVRGRIIPTKRGQPGKVLETPREKWGEPHRTPVSDEVAAAAQRLLDDGGLKYRRNFYRALQRAREHANLDQGGAKVLPGAFRHSVATWAVDSGSSYGEVATFLGNSEEMVRRHYAKRAVPAPVPTFSAVKS